MALAQLSRQVARWIPVGRRSLFAWIALVLFGVALGPRSVEAQEVEEPVERAPDAPPLSVEELYEDGYRLFAAGRFEEARRQFEAVLARQPRHRFAGNYLQECLSILGASPATTSESAPIEGEPADPPVAGGEQTGAGAEPQTETVQEATDGEESQVKKQLKNPRSDRQRAVGLGLVGPGVGISVWGQWLPFWFVGVLGGGGGVVPTAASSNAGLGAFFVEAQLLPIPWRLSPLFGVGTTVLLGGLASQVDAIGGVVATAERFRLVFYWLAGVRFDARNGLMLSAGLGFLPTGDLELPLIPFPSLRAGLRF